MSELPNKDEMLEKFVNEILPEVIENSLRKGVFQVYFQNVFPEGIIKILRSRGYHVQIDYFKEYDSKFYTVASYENYDYRTCIDLDKQSSE